MACCTWKPLCDALGWVHLLYYSSISLTTASPSSTPTAMLETTVGSWSSQQLLTPTTTMGFDSDREEVFVDAEENVDAGDDEMGELSGELTGATLRRDDDGGCTPLPSSAADADPDAQIRPRRHRPSLGRSRRISPPALSRVQPENVPRPPSPSHSLPRPSGSWASSAGHSRTPAHASSTHATKCAERPLRQTALRSPIASPTRPVPQVKTRPLDRASRCSSRARERRSR